MLIALGLGINADELCTIYRTQFPVLHGYDRGRDLFDANGRLVPNAVQVAWRRAGGNHGAASQDALAAVHPASGARYTYEPPFLPLNREADIRRATSAFSGQTL